MEDEVSLYQSICAYSLSPLLHFPDYFHDSCKNPIYKAPVASRSKRVNLRVQ